MSLASYCRTRRRRSDAPVVGSPRMHQKPRPKDRTRWVSLKLSLATHYMSSPPDGRADHVRLVLRIVLAEIFLHVLVRDPEQRPGARPGPRVCSRIVYQHFVSQRVEI